MAQNLPPPWSSLTLIIIYFQFHKSPQHQTQIILGYLPLAGSATTVWSKWNNMRYIKNHSYWTITAVCRYRDNDGSWFSPSCCHRNWPYVETQQQRHPVDTTDKVRLQQHLGSNKGTLQEKRSELVLRTRTKCSWLEPLKPLCVSQRCFHRSYPLFDLWFLRQHFLDLMNSPQCFLFHCMLRSLLRTAMMRAVEMWQLKHAVVH